MSEMQEEAIAPIVAVWEKYKDKEKGSYLEHSELWQAIKEAIAIARGKE